MPRQLKQLCSFTDILLWCKVVAIPAFTIHLGQISRGYQPGIVRAGSLGVNTVATTRLVPEDIAGSCVTNTLGLPLLLVVFEEEALRAGTLRVPLVTLPIAGPVVLIVAGAATAITAVTFARISFEHHKFTTGTRSLSTNLVTVTLTRVFLGWEVKMSFGAGIFRTETYPIIPLN